MFCKNCGKEIPEGGKFCVNCGTPTEAAGSDSGGNRGAQRNRYDVFEKGGGDKKNRTMLLAAAAAVFLASGIGYATAGLAMQKSRLVSGIENSAIPEYMERAENAAREWETLSFFDMSGKKEVLKDLKSIKEDVEVFDACAKEVRALQEEEETYHLEDSAYSAYAEILDQCSQAVKEKEAGDAVALLAEVRTSLRELKKANDAYISNVVEMYETADISEAEKSEADAYQTQIDKIYQLVKQEQRDYQAIKDAFVKMDEIAYLYVEPENPLEISIQQVDATEFPKVKLYLSVKDRSTGDVPENLKNGMFYIRKEDANAKYVKQVISNVNQLNEEEALKVDMVADVSGSMDGAPLMEAKRIMSNFVSSVQFGAGDMVELTSFSTGVRLEQEFCSDAGLLINRINNLYTGDLTSLYDALYTSVERVASQTGARCVIAFTDGDDNYSSCTRDSVIYVAQRYHVPVFIIGIGASDYSDASYIAQQTGGAYYSIYDVYSMNSIYEDIYRMEKELYLVEFEDSTGSKITDISNIEAGYRSMEYGGECRYSYTPNILLSVKGANLYKDGPEAVLERYLKGFDDAMTLSDFSYIADCLKPGSPIYQEQQAYVLRDITEQLDSFEIVSVDYLDPNNCIARTRETYFVQVGNKPLQLMTQECQYRMEYDGREWKLTAFADKIKVTSRINQ